MQINFKDIPGGFHKARLSDIKEETNIYGQYLKLIFTISEGELSHYRFSGLIKPTPIKQSKFYRWVTNILGKEPDDQFCTEDMIDKECKVLLAKRKRFYIVTEVHML